MRLKDKTCLVTGGGSGIGAAISRRLAAEGAAVHILDRDESAAAETAQAITEAGDRAAAHACDISDQAATDAVFDAVAAVSPIDVVVNNAGIAHIGNVETTTEEDLDRLYAVNIKGVYNGCRAAVRHMKPRGGCILNMASVVSMVGIPDRFAYSMTKGAVLTMTLSVAMDFIKDNIRCNAIAPGRVHTPFVDNYLAKTYPGKEQEMYDKLAATQPIGRMAEPEEIAALAAYLCSDEAAFVTGVCWPIDGGFVSLVP